MADLNDDLLIQQTLDGEAAAFEVLVRRYQDRLFGMITQATGCPIEAEDVVQETFVQAYTKLATFRRDSQFYTWLYRIAINASISRKRRKRPQLSVDQQQEDVGAEPADEGELPGERLEREERANQLQVALQRLQEEYRVILVLREMDEMSYEEIAEILEMPIGTVRSRLHRARSQLRSELEAMLYEHPADRGN